MAQNWIITQGGLLPDGTAKDGDPINLDFLAKVQWGGDFMTKTSTPASSAQQRSLVFFHGISNGSGTSGSTTAYKFKSPNLALAAKNKVIQAILSAGLGKDLRVEEVTLVACSMPAATAGVANTIVTLTGTGFGSDGQIKFADSTTGANSAAMPVGVVPDSGGTSCTFVIDTSIAAGTYDIEYTDSKGNAAVLTKGIVLS